MSNELGRRLRRFREARGITLSEVGRAVGVTHTAVSKWETGESQLPSEQLSRIAAAVGVTAADFFADDPRSPDPAKTLQNLVAQLTDVLRTNPARIEVEVRAFYAEPSAPEEFTPAIADTFTRNVLADWDGYSEEDQEALQHYARSLRDRRRRKASDA